MLSGNPQTRLEGSSSTTTTLFPLAYRVFKDTLSQKLVVPFSYHGLPLVRPDLLFQKPSQPQVLTTLSHSAFGKGLIHVWRIRGLSFFVSYPKHLVAGSFGDQQFCKERFFSKERQRKRNPTHAPVK